MNAPGRPRAVPLRATPLFRGDTPQAVIVVSDTDEAAVLAGGACAEFVAHAFGRSLPVLRESDWERARRIRGFAVIAMGSYPGHRLLGKLLLEGRHYSDAAYPGPGGYIVRTITDPAAEGRNTVVLTGGDEAGWDGCTQAFCDLLTYLDERAAVPPTHLVQSPLAPTPIEPTQVAGETESLLGALATLPADAAGRRLVELARSYDLWGAITAGMVLRGVLTRLAAGEGAGPWLEGGEWWLGPLARLWRNLEERSVFDDPLRLGVSRLIATHATKLEQRWHATGAPRAPEATAIGAASALWWSATVLPGAPESWGATARRLLSSIEGWPPLGDADPAAQAFALRELLPLARALELGRPQLARAAREWIRAYTPGADASDDLSAIAGWATLPAQEGGKPRPLAEIDLLPPTPGGLRDRPTASNLAPSALHALTWPAPAVAWAAEVSGCRLPDDPRLDLLAGAVALRSGHGARADYALVRACAGPHEGPERSQTLGRLDLGGVSWITDSTSDGSGTRWSAVTGRLHAGRIRIASLRSLDDDCPEQRLIALHGPGRGMLFLRGADAGGRVPPLVLQLAEGAQVRALDDGSIEARRHGRALWFRGLADGDGPQLQAGERTIRLPGAEGPMWEMLEASLHRDGWATAVGGLLVLEVGADRVAWAGVDGGSLARGPIPEAACDAWCLSGALGLAGMERLALRDGYLEATAPCDVLLDPVEGSARITAQAATEVYAASGLTRESALVPARGVVDIPFGYDEVIHQELLSLVSAAAPRREVIADETRDRGDDAPDGQTRD